jgi:hypothetical protein
LVARFSPQSVRSFSHSIALRARSDHEKALLAEHQNSQALPTSARFLFYELVQRGIVSKERKTQGRRPDQRDGRRLITFFRNLGLVSP